MSTRRLARAGALLSFTFLGACSSDEGADPSGMGGGLVGLGGAITGTGGALTTGGTGGSVSPGGAGGSTGGLGGASTGGTSTGGTGAGGLGGAGGGTGGAGGAGGSASGGAGGAPAEKPPCLKNDDQIVLMGDSYVNWISHTFPADINAVSGLTIDNFAIGAYSMGSGGIAFIPTQLPTALAAPAGSSLPKRDLKVVILDGGGNDVLVPDTVQFPQGGQCKNMGAQSPSIPDCVKIVDKALQAGRDLFFKMADEGVKDAVFFFYPKVPKNTLVGGTDPNGMLDYSLPKIKAQCDGAYEESKQINPAKTIRCHFVDMVPVFDGHADYFADADIHPNSKGSRAMAEAIWAKMKSACVAQPESSGCCTP